jgi:hypothetical protein
LQKRRVMDDIRSQRNHLACMGARLDQFPSIVEELSCLFAMSVSTATVDSVLSHARHVVGLGWTPLFCKLHEAMIAAAVRQEAFAEALCEASSRTGQPGSPGRWPDGRE